MMSGFEETRLHQPHTSLLSTKTALFLSFILSLGYEVPFQGPSMCLWLWEMKYSSHKKWLSSLSSTTHYNDSPVRAETRGIVARQRTHIWNPRGGL